MDETDKKILELVQKAEYCKPNLTALSEQLKRSVPTLHARIKKLEDRGIIQGYMANVDPKKAGEDMTIFIIIRVEYKSFYEDEGKQREFAKKLTEIPEVKEVHICGSDWDYLIKVRVKDADDYYKVAMEKIMPLGHIKKLESVVAYTTFKDTTQVAIR